MSGPHLFILIGFWLVWIVPTNGVRGKFQQNGAVVRAVPDQMSIGKSRKSSLPLSISKESIMSGLYVVLVFLSVCSSKDVSTKTQILQIAINDSVSKEVNDVGVHSMPPPPLFLIVKNDVKIPKNEPLLILLVTSQLIYEVTSKKLVLTLRKPIDAGGTPHNIIIRNVRINVVQILIYNSQIDITRIP
jgi:hypothetical protein